MLVRGPTGTRVISCGAAWTSSMIRSGPKRASTLHLLGGSSMLARTSNSGEWSASMRAMASSVPGSVSKMIFLPETGEAEITERKTRRRRNPMLRPGENKLYAAVRYRVEQGREHVPTTLADSLSATPLHEQHAGPRSRNKPPRQNLA